MDSTIIREIDLLFESPTILAAMTERGFFVFDNTRKRARVSAVWARMGYSTEDMWEHRYLESLHPDDLATFKKQEARLDSGEINTQCGEYRFRAADGTYRWLSVYYHVLERDEKGNILVMIGHDEDVTNLRVAQEEIRSRLLEIETLKDLLNSVNKSLDFEETVAMVMKHLQRVLPFDMASVQTWDGSMLHIIGSYGFDDQSTVGLEFSVRDVNTPASQALSTLRPIICNNVANEYPGFVQAGAKTICSWLGIPLIIDGQAIGLLALDSYQPDFYTDRHVRIAMSVAGQIAVAVEHARQHTKVKIEASTDRLTGASNRYGLETQGQELFQNALRDAESIALLMIDIDHFKNINDRFGHSCGDLVLKETAARINESLRSGDFFVRYGGEEFLVLLPASTTREALVVAERLRLSIPQKPVECLGFCPTVSVGIFSGIPDLATSLHVFIERADLALYEAKQAGRNRVRIWTPPSDFLKKEVLLKK